MRWHSCVEYPYDVSSCEGCYGEAMEKEGYDPRFSVGVRSSIV